MKTSLLNPDPPFTASGANGRTTGMAHLSQTPLTTLGKHMARVDGKTMVYTIKRSPRAIHVRLEVNAGTGLTVVIPMSYQLNLIPTLLNEKSRWIVDKLAYYGLARPPTARNKLKSGDAVPY